MLFEPDPKVFLLYGPGGGRHGELFERLVAGIHPPSVHEQEELGRGDGHALVSVDEWVVADEGMHQGGGLRGYGWVEVFAGEGCAGACHRGFQQSPIANAGRAPGCLQQGLVEGSDLDDAEVFDHRIKQAPSQDSRW